MEIPSDNLIIWIRNVSSNDRRSATRNARVHLLLTDTRARGARRHYELRQQTDPLEPRCGSRRRRFPFYELRLGAIDGARAFGANDHAVGGAGASAAKYVVRVDTSPIVPAHLYWPTDVDDSF